MANKKALTLDEVLTMLEEQDNLDSSKPSDIVIMPPVNACNDVTDEDSGEEDVMNINNLPGNQLRAEAEILNESSKEEEPIVNTSKRKEKKKKLFSWKKKDISHQIDTWVAVEGPVRNLTPLQWFSLFFDNEVIDLLVGETNKYAQHKNMTGDVSEMEIKCFIGILLLSGYCAMPRRKMYWELSPDVSNELVASAMSQDRFDFIFTNIHCNDNRSLDQKDKFAKVRPLFTALNHKFQEFAPIEQYHSIDEAMVPYFGHHGCKQFIKGKPIRYGYKLWIGATHFGYIVWAEPYQGAGTPIKEQYKEMGLGASVVLQYCDVVQSLGYNLPYHMFFDNFFTSMHLLEEISKKNMKGTGTVRNNRTSHCPLISNDEMKEKERGSYDYRLADNKIIVCKWNDNSIVTLASNASQIFPIQRVSRYSKQEKRKIMVTQPKLVHDYNEHMGGVDRSDQNISLYRVSMRGKKWYFPLIAHCIDMAVQNAWQLQKANKGKLDQLTFRRRIAIELLETNKRTTKRGPSKPSRLKNQDSRYDRLDHLVIPQDQQTRCRVCHQKCLTRCQKCNVGIHVKCFVSYHTAE